MATPAYALHDANLAVTGALPNGATSTNTTAIQTHNGTAGDFTAPCELYISAPALTTGRLPDSETMVYDVIKSANSDLSSPTVIADNVITQTGAGGAGAAAAETRVKLPSNVGEYVGVRATASSTVNASAVSMSAKLEF